MSAGSGAVAGSRRTAAAPPKMGICGGTGIANRQLRNKVVRKRPGGLFFAAGRDLDGRLYFPRVPVVKIADTGESMADSRDVTD
jgi:hypothetical protein